MSAVDLIQEKVWLERTKYEQAESAYYQRITKAPLTPLAEEVAKVRQRLIEISDTFEEPQCDVSSSGNNQFCDQKIKEFTNLFSTIQLTLKKFDDRLSAIEEQLSDTARTCTKSVAPIAKPAAKSSAAMEEDDDVDLFGSDSDEENDEAAAKIREARLAAYNQKKSTKTAIIAKSSVVLDIKPWEDTTDMTLMEELVRKITMDGLLWGASKLVPLAYGIKKLQISSVVVDDKVSIDELQEKIEAIEDLVQSVDIAAFNKI